MLAENYFIRILSRVYRVLLLALNSGYSFLLVRVTRNVIRSITLVSGSGPCLQCRP